MSDIVKEANKRARKAKSFWDENYRRMDEDIEFLHGEEQWPERIKREREDEGRPALTFNMLPTYVDQVTGDQRQTTPAIDIAPVNSDTKETKVFNYAGTKDYSLAETYQAIIRNIEYTSNADQAYDTGFEHCAGWGLGWIRLLSDYIDDESFDQDFKIKRVKNYKSVLVSPFDEPDGSDIQWGIIFTRISREEFESRWPGKEFVQPNELDADEIDLWIDKDYGKIGEYYCFKDDPYELIQLSDGTVTRDVGPILDELAAKGITVVNRRKVKGKKVVWYKISGKDVLEGPTDTPFSHIPLIPVVGKELVVDGRTIFRGVIRHAKDAQRMYNYARTAEIETVALQPKVPYIASDKQVAGYEGMWKNANRQNLGVLIYKSGTGDPSPQRQPTPMLSQGNVNLSLQAKDDIKGTTNMHDASMGAEGNEQSGKAILARQREGDTGNYSFIDNLSRSIGHLARILVKAIPRVYDTQRLVRLRFPDGTDDLIEINRTEFDEETRQEVTINDLSVGKFDVICKTGPSYNTQREEAAEGITAFIQALGNTDPITAKALTYLAVKNMDWADSDKVMEVIKKGLPPEIFGDEEQEPAPPTPQEQIEMAKVEAEMSQAEADKAKAEADMEKANADMAKAQATMMEVAEKMENLDESIKDAVAGAFAQLITEMNQREVA